MILVIDNYDSFTYNLVQYLGELGADVLVRRNDAVSVEEVGELEVVCAVLDHGPVGLGTHRNGQPRFDLRS